MKPRFIIEQKITFLVNKYRIFEVTADGSKGKLIALAQQKRIAFKEKVIFYTDESKTNIAFTFRAEKVMDFHGRFFVEDPNGQLVGVFKKDFGKSLINSTWHILGADEQPKLTFSESNAALAVLRRFGGEIPFVGILVELVLLFFKYHFTLRAGNGSEVGSYAKTTLIRDNYVLSIDDEIYNEQDWRVLAAVSVALDALQQR